MKTLTAAWYPDPGGQHEMRYWDGERWTQDVSDGAVVTTADGLQAGWGPPGAGQALAKRALVMLIVAVPLATILYVLWVLFVVSAEAGTAEAYGWVTFAQTLPVVIVMLIPEVLGFTWGVRSCRLGGGRDGRLVIWVSGAALAWVLVITDFAGLIPAVFGDTWDWTGFPLLVVKVATALGVTILALRASSRPKS